MLCFIVQQLLFVLVCVVTTNFWWVFMTGKLCFFAPQARKSENKLKNENVTLNIAVNIHKTTH